MARDTKPNARYVIYYGKIIMGWGAMASNSKTAIGIAVALALLTFAPLHGARAASFEVIHRFCSRVDCDDGKYPNGVVVDSSGEIFGTTTYGNSSSNGVLYQLAPPSGGAGAWSETVLKKFCEFGQKNACPKGLNPEGALIQDSTGNIYGTTYNGGVYGGRTGYGTAFKLSPPVGGQSQWTLTTIFTFGTGETGFFPHGRLAIDAGGNLYGVAARGKTDSPGSIFKLSPPAAGQTKWSQQTLFNFCTAASCRGKGFNPQDGVTIDGAGNLYVATTGGGAYLAGAIFKLSPPTAGATGWAYTKLYDFCAVSGCPDGSTPNGGMILKNGNLYGTTSAGGVNGKGSVFELVKPASGATAWKHKLLYSFCSLASCADGSGPGVGPILDTAGALYGTTLQGGYTGDSTYTGTIYKLTPPAGGRTKWTETVLRKNCYVTSCTAGRALGPITYAGAASGALYDGVSPLYGVATSGGGTSDNAGTLYQFTP